MSSHSNDADSIQTVINSNQKFRKINKQPYLFTEGPANDGKGKIYFVDYGQNQIVAYDTARTTLDTWASDTQGANGAAFLTSGQLVSCRGVARDLVLWRSDGTVERVLASEYQGNLFNSPNDLVINKAGWVYFTDPDFDEHQSMPEAVYALSPRGILQCIEQAIARPNGIVLSPDEHLLIINGTAQRELIAYDVDVNGQLSNRRIFAVVCDPDRESYPGYPERWFGCDGMAVDIEGHLYVTTGAGLQIFDRIGRFMGSIKVPEKPTNVCVGGSDKRTLFITARDVSVLHRM